MNELKSTNGVSSLQFLIITVNMMFGSSLLILPREVTGIAKQDMWISVLVAGVLFTVAFRVAAALAAYFPEHTSIEYHCLLLGRRAGNALSCMMLILMIAITTEFVRIFRTSVRIFLLDQTPSQVVVFILLALAVYAAQNGLEPVIRVQQFLLLFSYLTFIPIILLGLLAIHADHYTPLLAHGFTPVLRGVSSCWMAYSGPELVIGLLFPFFSQKNNVIQYGLFGIGVVTILYVLISAITLGILGASEITHLLVPTVMAYRSIELPDTFIERIDGYLMIVWIVICFSSLVNWFYFIGFSIARMVKLESSRPVMVLLAPVMAYLIAVLPDFYSTVIIVRWINISGVIWCLGILPLLLILAWWRKRRQAYANK